MDYEQFARQIHVRSGMPLGPAREDQLAALISLGAPKSIVEFYRLHEPQPEAEIGQVRLQGVFGILRENMDYVPGSYLRPLGFFVFATTVFGDAYCFDLKSSLDNSDAAVVIMAHDLDFESADQTLIMSAKKQVADGFDGFLTQFLAGALDIDPIYPPS
jgi:hypothetical protein